MYGDIARFLEPGRVIRKATHNRIYELKMRLLKFLFGSIIRNIWSLFFPPIRMFILSHLGLYRVGWAAPPPPPPAPVTPLISYITGLPCCKKYYFSSYDGGKHVCECCRYVHSTFIRFCEILGSLLCPELQISWRLYGFPECVHPSCVLLPKLMPWSLPPLSLPIHRLILYHQRCYKCVVKYSKTGWKLNKWNIRWKNQLKMFNHWFKE